MNTFSWCFVCLWSCVVKVIKFHPPQPVIYARPENFAASFHTKRRNVKSAREATTSLKLNRIALIFFKVKSWKQFGWKLKCNDAWKTLTRNSSQTKMDILCFVVAGSEFITSWMIMHVCCAFGRTCNEKIVIFGCSFVQAQNNLDSRKLARSHTAWLSF